MKLVSALLFLAVLTPHQYAQEFENLFDGSSLAAFRGYRQESFPTTGWTVEDGALLHIAGGGGGDLITRSSFGDFDLRFEWRVAKGANSGVMYRVSESQASPWATGPEYQVLDDAEHQDGRDPKTSAGAVYGLLPAVGKVLRPVGEFNAARILVLDGVVEHWLNGVRVARYEIRGAATRDLIAASKFKDLPRFAMESEGHLVFQDHGDEVAYRNIRILRIPKGARRTLFNGRDLAGWTHYLREGGTLEGTYGVKDGVVICQGNPAGYIRTTEKYRDFRFALRWRWSPEKPPGGNSGVLLRVTGEDRVWPRSIEAQLQAGSAGDFWNIGEVPMHTDPRRLKGRNTKRWGGVEKPHGEWNEYEILVLRGTVELRVNGMLVNQAFDAEHIAGFLALQSEGAEIHFKDAILHQLDAQ